MKKKNNIIRINIEFGFMSNFADSRNYNKSTIKIQIKIETKNFSTNLNLKKKNNIIRINKVNTQSILNLDLCPILPILGTIINQQ